MRYENFHHAISMARAVISEAESDGISTLDSEIGISL